MRNIFFLLFLLTDFGDLHLFAFLRIIPFLSRTLFLNITFITQMQNLFMMKTVSNETKKK